MENDDLLHDLNDEQRAAAAHTGGPLLIIAGAGTGKTTVITKRIAWLIQEGIAKPDEILALTFTEKAAGEMEERVDRLLPYGYVDLWVSTFHSFGERILRDHALEIGLPNRFRVLSETEQWLLLRKHFDRLALKHYRPLGNPTRFLKALLNHFSRAQDELVTPEQYLEFVKGLQLDADVAVGVTPPNPSFQEGGSAPPLAKGRLGGVTRDEIERLSEIANAFHTYKQLLREQDLFDFGDLINEVLRLFRSRPTLLDVYRKKFKAILVDEFQDTNAAQYELIKLLAPAASNLTVVGDDDQCLPAGTLVAVPNGVRAIEKIKTGDTVITAIGKGAVGVGTVTNCQTTSKTARLITVVTETGTTVTTTDNHKMFCYVPTRSDGTLTYVYLMKSAHYGWRIGVTNDLSVRLRLERGADEIVGLRSFGDPKEARYYEMLWMLRYSIPPVCFKERDGVSITGEWLEKLYHTVDSEQGAKRLARSLGIDLTSPHVRLGSVTRGNSERIKIRFEICHRSYAPKLAAGRIMNRPMILHQVTLETSNPQVIAKLRNGGIPFMKAKKGVRVRRTGVDIQTLAKFARHLSSVSNAKIEHVFAVGRLSSQTQKAVVMPAGNLLVGHFLPVWKGGHVKYEKISSITDQGTSNTNVYDLEIDKTHNFIANNVVVHNSIYKFRGAAISNILQFSKDYPDATRVVLTKNYRSGQDILDFSYRFIQNNNPNRLEVVLGGDLSKQLQATRATPATVVRLHAETLEEEARLVRDTIVSRLKEDPTLTYGDVAILVRANDHAAPFVAALSAAGIPHEFQASRGLYTAPVILDVLSYLRLLDNYHESPSVFRILNSAVVNIQPDDVARLTQYAARKGLPLFEVLRRASAVPDLRPDTFDEIRRLLGFIEKHAERARREPVGAVVLAFLHDTEYLKKSLATSDEEKKLRVSRLLSHFWKRVERFAADETAPTTKHFLERVGLELDAGDAGDLPADTEAGPDVVRIMTIHGAKGLEFRIVFLINLVDRRFPTSERSDPLPLPDAFIRETLTEGDSHLEEERRLFYVGCTRAKDALYLTSADDYGGARKKKPSRFLVESGLITTSQRSVMPDLIRHPVPTLDPGSRPVMTEALTPTPHTLPTPDRFSFTQFAAFEKCPLQYKFAHLYRVPVRGKSTFSFGKSVHLALQEFMKQYVARRGTAQGMLFPRPAAADGQSPLPAFEDLEAMYRRVWIDEWYENPKAQDERFAKGLAALKRYYDTLVVAPPEPLLLEQQFVIKINGVSVKGAIDRIDRLPDGSVEIIDYKTGEAKADDRVDWTQLYLYQIAAEDVLGLKPSKLTFLYIEDVTPRSTIGTPEDLQKLKDRITSLAGRIRTSSFEATPDARTCSHCDFKDICEFRAT